MRSTFVARVAGLLMATALIFDVSSSPSFAGDVQLSGLVEGTFKNSKESQATNASFAGITPFDTARLRLFVDAALSEGTDVFAQILSSNDDFVLYGAYVRFSDIADTRIGAQLGLIPNTVGTFGERTYSDKNPLIGTPLLWVHHTVLTFDAPLRDHSDLRAARTERSPFGLPMLYDNCWNSGTEVYGTVGAVDWSVAALAGSVTKPMRNQKKDLPQGTAKLSWSAGPQFRVTASGYFGPYLATGVNPDHFAPGDDPEDFMNSGALLSAAWISRYVDVVAEGGLCRWEHPLLPTLGASSGAMEFKWKVRPRWYLAARADTFVPTEITDENGVTAAWDDSVHKWEYGIGYKPRPRTLVKLVGQNTRFDEDTSYNADVYALQVSVAF